MSRHLSTRRPPVARWSTTSRCHDYLRCVSQAAFELALESGELDVHCEPVTQADLTRAAGAKPCSDVHCLTQWHTQQLDEMQKNRMIVFLEDYNNYRAFSRCVAWRSSSHPPLNDVLDLVMQHTSQWNADDTPNTIVCCGWTSRQTIHVLRLEDMRQTHPFLVNNLVTFTHWVNSLFSN